eukprot:TRINITY_DN8393_c0_g1_i1.p1 TRINITY_DN8393_c0_g1~~TRINITY_DN8393_c0_g1_i1.p1  ORF type:complete len:720 (-),score=146.08 TRINITY_DN8393_c0_g1_i1:88-2247(-)
MNTDCVRVVVVGDHASGKTCLITTLVRGSFQVKVPPKIPPVLLNRQEEHVRTMIIDTSSKLADQHQVDDEIRRAHFICVVYDSNVALTQTISSILSWMGRIEKLVKKVPMALIGTKTDLRKKTTSSNRNEELEEELKSVLRKHDQIELLLECSALDKKSQAELDELFLLAQYSVLYPRMPLCDSKSNFRPEFVSVLKRIFQLVDVDKDGYLDLKELKSVQHLCFKEELDDNAAIEIMETIRNYHPQGVVQEKGINEGGFLSLFHLIMERGRTETIWSLLRHFGYDNALNIREDFLQPDIYVPPGYEIELSKEGYQYLTDLFLLFSRNNSEHVLTWSQLDKMFMVVPDNSGHPWQSFDFPDCCATSMTARIVDDASTTVSSSTYSYDSFDPNLHFPEHEPVTLKGYLAMWALITLLDPKVAMRYMYYLGFCGKKDRTECITITKERTTFFGYVLGAPGVGKSSVIKAFLGKEFSMESGPERQSMFGVNSVEIPGRDTTFHLVLNEPPASLQDSLLSSKNYADKMKLADIVLLVYDQSDPSSFVKVMQMFSHLDRNYREIPCLIVATKSDRDPSQSYPPPSESSDSPKKGAQVVVQKAGAKEIKPREFCTENGLMEPIFVSSKNNTGLSRLFTLTIETILEKKPRNARRGIIRKLTTWGLPFFFLYALYLVGRHYFNLSPSILWTLPSRFNFSSYLPELAWLRARTGSLGWWPQQQQQQSE